LVFNLAQWKARKTCASTSLIAGLTPNTAEPVCITAPKTWLENSAKRPMRFGCWCGVRSPHLALRATLAKQVFQWTPTRRPTADHSSPRAVGLEPKSAFLLAPASRDCLSKTDVRHQTCGNHKQDEHCTNNPAAEQWLLRLLAWQMAHHLINFFVVHVRYAFKS